MWVPTPTIGSGERNVASVPCFEDRFDYFRLSVDVLDLSDQVERETGQGVLQIQKGVLVLHIEHLEIEGRIDSAADGKSLTVEDDLLGEYGRSRIVHCRVGEVQKMPSVAHEDFD